jgi:hypothetical protein
MKTTSFCVLVFVSLSLISNAQTSDKKAGLQGLRFSYNISMNDNVIGSKTLIPYGCESEIVYSLNKRFSADAGIKYRTTGMVVTNRLFFADLGYHGPNHIENTDTYLDIPIHLNFNVIKTNPFNIDLSAGYFGTVYHNNNLYYPDKNGIEHRSKNLSFSTGLEIGVTENFNLSSKMGLFLSQYYGQFLTGELSKYRTMNLNFGLFLKLSN